MMVPSPRQCPGEAGKVCNCFLPAKENDPHGLCTGCRGKICDIEDSCEDCHDWFDEKCRRVDEYLATLPAQCKKEHERKAKASSSSSSLFRILPFYACAPV